MKLRNDLFFGQSIFHIWYYRYLVKSRQLRAPFRTELESEKDKFISIAQLFHAFVLLALKCKKGTAALAQQVFVFVVISQLLLVISICFYTFNRNYF